MRTITWVSPTGVTKTITIGGRRRRPVPSYRTTALESFETFLDAQRERVEHNLQQTLWRVQAYRNDGMTPDQIRSETSVTRRA